MICSNDALALYVHAEVEKAELLLLFGDHYLRGILVDRDLTTLKGDNQEEFKGIVVVDLLKDEAYIGGSVRLGKKSDYLPKLKLTCKRIHWESWYNYGRTR